MSFHSTGALCWFCGCVALAADRNFLGLTQCRSVPQNSVAATGSLKNFSTIEGFKDADKSVLFNSVAEGIWKSINVDNSTAFLNCFLVITFADIKKYSYFYWFTFPAFVSKPA